MLPGASLEKRCAGKIAKIMAENGLSPQKRSFLSLKTQLANARDYLAIGA